MRKIIFLSEAPAYELGSAGKRYGPIELTTPDGKSFTSREEFEKCKKNGDLMIGSDGTQFVTTPSGDVVSVKGDGTPHDIKWSNKPLKPPKR